MALIYEFVLSLLVAKIIEERYEIIEDIGFIGNLNPQNLYLVIKKLLENKTYYKKIIHKCDNLFDGKGAKRIGKIIVGGKNV